MHLRLRLRRLRLRAEHGFTTVTLMGVLLVGGLLVTASVAAVSPDVFLTGKDSDYKKAYGAAEAGINYYLSGLGLDNSYYLRCTNVPPPGAGELAPVNQAWNGSGVDPRKWRKLPRDSQQPASTPRPEYTIELLPAKGFSTCIENRQDSMIDASAGTIRIRATGRYGERTRSVVAALRRRSFIDFLYLTDFETSDPATYATASEQAQASNECQRYRAQRTSFCNSIVFPSFDTVNGPLHTNDDIIVCGSPTFGRTANDKIELNGTSPGYAASGGCGATPNFQGTRKWPGGQLAFPPSNGELLAVATAGGLVYTGRTRIIFNGTSMQVTNPNLNGGNPFTASLPANGVIYIKSGSCSTGGYQRVAPPVYNSGVGCANAIVQGHYGKDLTIAADNDVIIDEDLTRDDPEFLLGLIANNFIRVHHPVTTSSGSCTGNNGGPGAITIHAAMLAIQHSFIVDNYFCGSPLGSLTIDGAISQRFRGPVGTFSGSTIQTGYTKNYSYNDRLRFREPPYFINPVQSAWGIVRQTEQVPARK